MHKSLSPCSSRLLAVVACVSIGCGLDAVGSAAPGDATVDGGGALDGKAPARTDDAGHVISDDGGSVFLDGATEQSPPLQPFLTVVMANVSSTTNLTTEGKLDWSHWGRSSLKSRDRKMNGVGISDYTITSTPPFGSAASASPTDFNWSDGTTQATESGTPTYDWYGDNTSATNSFTITADVDASTSKRIATFYLGVWYGKGHLELALSDASAPPYTSDALDMSNGQTVAKYTAEFAAGTPTAKLRLRWTLAKPYVSQGAIRIAAISLQ